MELHGVQLPPPAVYFPLEKGKYEVAPGLRSLGTDFGNAGAEGRVFQLDADFKRYRDNKLKCRQERLPKYYATSNQSLEVTAAVNLFLVNQLVKEYPALFILDQKMRGSDSNLHCTLTSETLKFNSKGELINPLEYTSAFDAICSQVQEDIAVMSAEGVAVGQSKNWLSSIHLCSPSHWAAEDKIGKDFATIHTPVPGIAKINQAASSYIDAMIKKGPYVRFVWGISYDDRLNHHPNSYSSRQSDSLSKDAYFLRVERQVLWGLPDVNAAVFCIHVYTTDLAQIRKDETKCTLLKSGLLSMTPESREYKGVGGEKMDALIKYLMF